MALLLTIIRLLGIFIAIILIGWPLIAIPASLTLPGGKRAGISSMTLQEGTNFLVSTHKTSLELVEEARRLVGERMQYCRRNSFDSCSKAFERGLGYCQQSAFALVKILHNLGFEAQVISATRNCFPDGKISGHAWVKIIVNGVGYQIDPRHTSAANGELLFTPLTKTFIYTPFFRLFAAWGSTAVNAFRFYRTRSDTD